MHSEIYTRRDDLSAIIHCHCPVITAFAVAGIPINKPILPDFALYFDEIPLIKYTGRLREWWSTYRTRTAKSSTP